MTARDYFHDTEELSGMSLLFIDLCLCAIVVLAIIIVLAMAVQ